MVMQVLNTTCSQWPCRTHSSEFQDTGRVKVMFISSWASRPKHTQKKPKTYEETMRADDWFNIRLTCLLISFKLPLKEKTLVSLVSSIFYTQTQFICLELAYPHPCNCYADMASPSSQAITRAYSNLNSMNTTPTAGEQGEPEQRYLMSYQGYSPQ